MSNSTDNGLPPKMGEIRKGALGVGLLAVLFVLGIFVLMPSAREHVFQAYLFAFLLYFGLPMGSLAFLMIHHMTGGAWSFMTQRILEASMRTLPLMALLFLPILIGPLFGAHTMYDGWVHPESEIVQAKQAYLNVGFWTLRAVAFFALWNLISLLFNHWSKRLDDTGNGRIVLKFRRAAPPCLLLYCVTITFAATDWVMSLEPEWFSTIYGPLFWISQGLTVLAFTIIILSFLEGRRPVSQYLTLEHYHHLGNLLLAFVVLWAYMSFSQYLIIWSGNLPEEIHWYLARGHGGWLTLSLGLMAFHFCVPLMLLLFRRNKMNVRVLRMICYWILFWRLADVFWIVNPAFTPETTGIEMTDVYMHILLFGAMGGIWLWCFLGELGKRTLLPLNDPRFYEAVGSGNQSEGEAAEHA